MQSSMAAMLISRVNVASPYELDPDRSLRGNCVEMHRAHESPIVAPKPVRRASLAFYALRRFTRFV
jgi:hypothetical protein